MKVVVVGDSVMWGQGLNRYQKIHELASRGIAAEIGVSMSQLEIRFQAHSGAVIDEPELPAPLDTRVVSWQEVPHSTPTVIEQVDQALPSAPQPDPTVDLVILNGGINDIDFRVILDPSASDHELERRIRKNCYSDMLQLLKKSRNNFPNAVIVVIGYYPILSEASSLDVIRLTVDLLRLTVGPIGPLISAAVAPRSVRRMRYFHRRQLSWLRRAVTEMHAQRDTRGPGVLFAHPALGPQNSVGAPDPLLFGPKAPRDADDAWERFRRRPLTNVLALEPDDPVSRSRRTACETLVTGSGDRLQCFVASIGHPNPRGAQRYADVIKSVVLANRRISLRASLSHILDRDRNLSARNAMRRYGLAQAPVSMHNFSQHLTVDCIDVTIKTRDERFAGTDHDVYLRMGPGWEWKLNENVFEGDLFNDFERGVTTTYTIDPAEGRPDERLRLSQISEITLELRLSPEGLLTEPIGAWKPEQIRVALNGREVLSLPINKELTFDDPTWTAPDYPRAV